MFLSIDPGIANCGLSVIDASDSFKVIETHLVKNTRKFTDEEKEIEAKYGSRTVKVNCILEKIKELMSKYEIDTIALEAPFYNALTPMAYSALLEVIMAIKYKIILETEVLMVMIEPLLVKKLFTNKGMANKEAMKFFLRAKVQDKTIIMESDIDTLSEHEIDAVAVGFVYHLTSKNIQGA